MSMTLDTAAVGRPLTVVSAHLPGDAVSRRLAELGVRPGAAVRLLSRTSGGGAILAIGDDRLAVSRAILRAIDVTDRGPKR